jgi:hypothetical protein
MKIDPIRRFALALPEVTEEPHFQSSSFRVRGKIFATMPPDGEYLHIFVSEEEREMALAMESEFIEKLFWGGKVSGLRINIARAKSGVVNGLLTQAWSRKAPRSLVAKLGVATEDGSD